MKWAELVATVQAESERRGVHVDQWDVALDVGDEVNDVVGVDVDIITGWVTLTAEIRFRC